MKFNKSRKLAAIFMSVLLSWMGLAATTASGARGPGVAGCGDKARTHLQIDMDQGEGGHYRSNRNSRRSSPRSKCIHQLETPREGAD